MINEIIEKISEIFVSKEQNNYFDLQSTIFIIFNNEIQQLENLKNTVLTNKEYFGISQFYLNKYSNKNIKNNEYLMNVHTFLISKKYTQYELENISNIELIKECLKFSNYPEHTNFKLVKFFKDYEEILNLFSLENMKSFKNYCKDYQNKEVLANYIDTFVINNKNILDILK